MASDYRLTGVAGCPECGVAVSQVRAEIGCVDCGHYNREFLAYTYLPCGHMRIVRRAGEPCECETIVMTVIPRDLAEYTEDAERSKNSARALGIAILVSIGMGLLMCVMLIWILNRP